MMKRIFCSLFSLVLIVAVSGDLMAAGRRLSTGGANPAAGASLGAGGGSGVGVRGGDVSTSAVQSRWDRVKDFFSFGKKSASQSLGTKFDDAGVIRDAVRDTMELKAQSEQTPEVSVRRAEALERVLENKGSSTPDELVASLNPMHGPGFGQLAPAPQAHVPTPNRFKRAGIAMKRGFNFAGAGIATTGKATSRAFVAAGKATGSGIAVAGRAVKKLQENIRARIARMRAARRSSSVVHRVPSE